MKSLVAFCVIASGLMAVAQPAHVPADWLVYRDEANGITFRYPPNLKIVTPSLSHMHVRGLVSLVQLWSADDPNWPVLTMTVSTCGAPGLPCLDSARLRQACHSFAWLPLGNAQAFQCVDFGSGPCHWSAQVNRDTLRIGIAAGSAEHEVHRRTHDRDECAEGLTKIPTLAPIEGILASFVFDK